MFSVETSDFPSLIGDCVEIVPHLYSILLSREMECPLSSGLSCCPDTVKSTG